MTQNHDEGASLDGDLAAVTGAASFSAVEAFWIGVEYAANYLAHYARKLGGPQDWRVNSMGWPVDPEGAARRELHVFAGLIEESIQHEQLSPTFPSFAQAIEATSKEPQP